MGKITIIVLAGLFACASPALADVENYCYTPFRGHTFELDGNISVRFDDGSIFLTDDRTDDELEITQRHDLIVNGKKVPLTTGQKELVGQFHEDAYQIIDDAVEIGVEAAKIGLAGAGLGLKAVGRVAKLLLSSYDEDDLERDMDQDAEKIEMRAEEIERRAEKIERRAEGLEDLFMEMANEIPAIEELDGFKRAWRTRARIYRSDR